MAIRRASGSKTIPDHQSSGSDFMNTSGAMKAESKKVNFFKVKCRLHPCPSDRVLASHAVDRGSKSRSGHTKDLMLLSVIVRNQMSFCE